VPVVLLALINKGERSDLSKSEQNELKKSDGRLCRGISGRSKKKGGDVEKMIEN
jgi:hypothetical protein